MSNLLWAKVAPLFFLKCKLTQWDLDVLEGAELTLPFQGGSLVREKQSTLDSHPIWIQFYFCLF